MWIEFGRIHLPQGHHPNDVEKEWGKLIVAMLEREKSLRPELERYVECFSSIICQSKNLFFVFLFCFSLCAQVLSEVTSVHV